MRFEEFDTWLRRLGWVLDRQKGAHRHYRHPELPYRLTIAQHGRELDWRQQQRILADMRRFGQGNLQANPGQIHPR